MGKKAGHKATKKFAKSGQLKKTIKARHQHREVKKRIERKKTAKKARGGGEQGGEAGSDKSEDEVDTPANASGKKTKFSGMSVDAFLDGNFAAASDDDEDMDDSDEGEEDGSDAESDSSFSSLDDLDDTAHRHAADLGKLAKTDPEFFKYLQLNDKELLDFNPDEEEDVEESDEEAGTSKRKAKVLTKETLARWQRAILEQYSLRALRNLILAFRSAVRMGDSEDDASAKEPSASHYRIDSTALHSKVISTALRYTPIVLSHHIPLKTLPSGKTKPPQMTPKLKALLKLVSSYFYNVLQLLDQNADEETQTLALKESGKLLPFIELGGSNRKALKTFMKTCLGLWSTASDSVRIVSFLALREVTQTSGSEGPVLDMLLKMTYQTLVRSFKHTTTFTYPSITLMKSTAAELYSSHGAAEAAYQHAFKYIRQLAIHLRESLKKPTKDSYQQVYNWQFAHCLDFWAIVLSNACDRNNKESSLEALIYPLVQIALGSTKLNNNARSFPFHLQIVRSMLRLCNRTTTYIPLGATLLPIAASTLSPNAKHKPSTLRPLDLELCIRAPSQYSGTRVYSEALTEESVYLMAEWLASPTIGCSIAYPEVAVPLIMALKKAVKGSKGGKEAAAVKGLVEHAEESAQWVAEQRKGVKFGPSNLDEVFTWEENLRKKSNAPMPKWVGLLKKQKEKRKEMVQKANEGKSEIVGQGSEPESESE